MTKRSEARLAALAVVLATSSCARPRAPSSYQRPSIVLITIDTLRADRLGAYGNRSIETRNLDGIARDGMVFEQASAVVPLTLPSHTTIFTGRYPPSHGVRDNGSFVLDAAVPTATEVLKARGYRTGAFVGSYVLAARFGLNRGFDLYDDRFGFSGETAERRAGEVVSAAMHWLEAGGNRPFFCWIHLNDPHTPYDPPEPFHTRYAGRLYDGEVAYADSSLEPLISLLRRRSWYEGSAIVVAGDHGESLGEHRESTHGFFLYQSTLRIPLLVKLPGNQWAGRREAGPVSLADVGPTLLSIAGERAPLPGGQGTSLADPSKRASPTYAETLYPQFNFGWSRLRSVRDGRWKYIEAPTPELYDLASDPSEARNVCEEQAERASRMQAWLEAAGDARPARSAVPAGRATAEKLRTLGYLASTEPARASAADPKEKIELYERIAAAQIQLAAGRAKTAAAMLEAALRIDPGIALAHHQLGTCYARLGKGAAAAEEFRLATDLNPRMAAAWFDLGLVQSAGQDFRAAEASFQQVLQVNPADGEAWFELGRAQLRARDFLAARASFERARQNGFSSSQFHAEFGWLLMENKDATAAIREYTLALEQRPDNAVLHNNLGFALASSGDLRSAAAEYRRALELDGSYARARINLDAAMKRLPPAGKNETGDRN
jgi:arylsulfatase A-like enzyme/Tfp pilus assembly protein PilF